MKNQATARILKSATLPVLCFALTFATSMLAQSGNGKTDSEGCSNRTLLGDYGAQIEGTILGPNLPLRTVAMIHFDGEGSLTSVDHVVLNGLPPAEEWRANSGTYTVNPDCTGSAVFSGPIPVHFVVVKRGKEFHGVVDGGAITIVGYGVK